jgi:hypothetical protein
VSRSKARLQKTPVPPPDAVAQYRDEKWRRDPELRVENVLDAERLVNEAGFLFALTDVRRPGPSLYTAVCGRRDAHLPRNVQKDPESSLTWRLKDDLMRRGNVYYAKVIKGLATFISAPLVPSFNAVFGLARNKEASELSPDALKALKILRKEWELASSDLRTAAGFDDRKRLTKALDELQKRMKVIPSDVLYEPWFTYIWSVTDARFKGETGRKLDRATGLREIARAFLTGAGVTYPGELARILGLSRSEVGLANLALVEEGFADLLETGTYAKKGAFEGLIE